MNCFYNYFYFDRIYYTIYHYTVIICHYIFLTIDIFENIGILKKFKLKKRQNIQK